MVDKEKIQEDRISQAEPYEGYWQDSYDFVFGKLEKYFEDSEFSRAVEFGSGKGKFFERYAEYFEEVIAIEKDWKNRDNAMENAYWNDLAHIEFRSSEDDGDDLEEKSFDFVFIGQSFRHMKPEEAKDMIEKSRKLLRSGGILVIFVPHLKKGQERFLKIKLDKEKNYVTEEVGEDEFSSIDREGSAELGIQRYRSEDFLEKEGFELSEEIYFHDLILPGFIDKYVSRDAVINKSLVKGKFGSEMAVVLKRK